ncbi:MAG TPA: nuclear transport factor 2 family protein [Desulfobacterales bacterium]|nr:nuclear transport factor 2 family protein [Desulfobacterales bacterium]
MQRLLKTLIKRWPETILIILFTISLTANSVYSFSNSDIQTRIDTFQRGMQSKNIDVAMSIFEKGAIWKGMDTYNYIRENVLEMFGFFDTISLRQENLDIYPENEFIVSSGRYALNATIKGKQTPFQKTFSFSWLWRQGAGGWKVVASSYINLEDTGRKASMPTGISGKTMPIDIEVIGFDIKKDSKEEKQLQEIARSGGGSYLPASNAAELSKALQVTVDESIRKTLPPARQNEELRFETVGGTDWEKGKSGPGRQVDTYAPDYEQYDMGSDQKKGKRDSYAPDYEQGGAPEGQVETR